jgi:hypothetical protein
MSRGAAIVVSPARSAAECRVPRAQALALEARLIQTSGRREPRRTNLNLGRRLLGSALGGIQSRAALYGVSYADEPRSGDCS